MTKVRVSVVVVRKAEAYKHNSNVLLGKLKSKGALCLESGI